MSKISKKSWCEKNRPDIYNEILIKTSDIDGTWGLKTWHFLNGNIAPKCYCGNSVKFISFKGGYREFCSADCMRNSPDIKKKRKNTNMDRYGVENPSQSKEIRMKIEKTNLEKYGVKYPLMNEDIYNDYLEKIQIEFGVNNISELDSVKEKRKNTNLKKYGVESFTKSEEYLIKSRITKERRYGDSNYNNRDKYKKTMLDNYGVNNPLKLESIKKKVVDTNLSKYGKEYYTQTEEYLVRRREAIFGENHKYYSEYGYELIEYINNDRVILKCEFCNENFETTKQLFRFRNKDGEIECTNCNPITNGTSKLEIEIKEYINSLGIEFIENDRDMLGDKEIDIYIPDRKIGIEVNGLYWHSELFRDKNYHYDKMVESKEKGVQLIQIWEDQWMYKKDIVKSIINAKLGLITNKIFARKCEIVDLDYKVCAEFLDKNHIQGNVSSKIRYGLIHNGVLVSVISFGGLRRNLGQNKKEGEFELLRYASIKDTIVIGGFSKLLKYFKTQQNPRKITSYALSDYSNGNLYEKNGFMLEHHTKANFFYIKNKKRYNRFRFRKDVLIKEGEDPTKTSAEIMRDRGYYRIYDSGSFKYIL